MAHDFDAYITLNDHLPAMAGGRKAEAVAAVRPAIEPMDGAGRVPAVRTHGPAAGCNERYRAGGVEGAASGFPVERRANAISRVPFRPSGGNERTPHDGEGCSTLPFVEQLLTQKTKQAPSLATCARIFLNRY